MTIITVDNDTFRSWFPALASLTNEAIQSAYAGSGSYIALTAGAIGLNLPNQTRGVYLATAHIAYLMANPDKFRQLSSASEGSVSASFALPPTKDLWQYYLSLTPYGLELLALLSTVQPPLPEKNSNLYPYYNALGVR